MTFGAGYHHLNDGNNFDIIEGAMRYQAGSTTFFITGEYGDESDADERYFAACALYQATGQAYYLNDASTLYKSGRSADFGWADMGG